MTDKRLGKIESVAFGRGGYQGSQFGLTLNFAGKGWDVSAFVDGWWDTSVKCTEHCKWTEDDRTAKRAEMCERVSRILHDAKVYDVADLKNKPVEVEFEGMVLKDWRVLTEVL